MPVYAVKPSEAKGRNRYHLSCRKVLDRVGQSRVPEGGWTNSNFRTRNGRRLVRDMAVVHRVATVAGIRKMMPKLVNYFDTVLEDTIALFEEKASRRGVLKGYGVKDMEFVLEPGTQEAMWTSALEEVMGQHGLGITTTLTSSAQSVADSVNATTAQLLGGSPSRQTQPQLNRRVRRLGEQITRINDSTRAMFRRTLEQGIHDQRLTPPEMSKLLKERIPALARSRMSTIARTEMSRAADEGRKQAIVDSGAVTHVSVIGCEAREPRSPTYRGESTCNIEDVPIGDIDLLEFHINHTGTIVPSRFAGEDAGAPDDPGSNDDGDKETSEYRITGDVYRAVDDTREYLSDGGSLYEYANQTAATLSSRELRAVSEAVSERGPYVSSTGRIPLNRVNNYLTANKTGDIAEGRLKDRIVDLDDAISKSVADRNQAVFANLGAGHIHEVGSPLALSLEPGKVLVSEAYTVANLSATKGSVTGWGAGSGTVRINIPKGSNYFPLYARAPRDATGTFQLADEPFYGPTLLPRNARFVVRGRYYDDVLEKDILEVDMVPPDLPVTKVPGKVVSDSKLDTGLLGVVPNPVDVSLSLRMEYFGVDNLEDLAKEETLFRKRSPVDFDRVAKKVEKAVRESDVYMAMTPATMNKAIRDNQFKNSLESGKGTFKTIGEERAARERRFLGITADLTDTDAFPKYGFLASKGDMDFEGIVGFGYGNTYVRFKRSAVERRATITFGDSYNNNTYSNIRVSPPTSLVNPDGIIGARAAHHAVENASEGFADRVKEGFDSGNITKVAGSGAVEYVEAQLYGRVTMDDVEEIFVESKKQMKSLTSKLKKTYPGVKVSAARFDTRIKGLDSIDSTYGASLRPKDIDRLVDSDVDRLPYISFYKKSYTLQGRESGWPEVRARMPEDIAAIAEKGKDALTDDKRIFYKWFYEEMPKGSGSVLPLAHQERFRKSQIGWVDDVVNESLLKK